MQLSQEEQIALLKGCVFELASIVVTRHYNPETTSLILSREVFPASIFRPSEQAELNFFLGVNLYSKFSPKNVHLNSSFFKRISIFFFDFPVIGIKWFHLQMHSCIHELAQLRLTSTEMGLLSAWILLDRSSLGQYVIEQFRNCLQQQIATRVCF